MKIFIIFLTVFFYVQFSFSQSQKIIKKNGRIYLSNTLIVKMKDGISQDQYFLQKKSKSFLNTLNSVSSKKIFPVLKNKTSSLKNIIEIKFNSDIDPFLAAKKLIGDPDIEWAEPRYIRELQYTPNDFDSVSQYALNKIQAKEAWEISKGDASIVIGIVDTGIDWDHPDLAQNIWINSDEIPDNGFDDDNNGYIDDYRGWDFGGADGTADNDPMEDKADHGTHVAGIASAVTDNGIGISSIGFNSKLMAVKTTQNNFRDNNGNPYVVYGYEGVIYAVDNGAKVINCSWGGSGFSLLEEEIVNYAISQGALIVAAAGNDNSDLPHYPSGYTGVLSVASTTSLDTKSGFSNYGSTIDVSSPGSAIRSTWQNDTYTVLGGTSMSAPLAAGLAALAFHHFPSYSPLQIAEQIRVNSDDISSQNPVFAELLGRGRINAFKTLNNINSISVRADNVIFSDQAPGGNGDGILQPGETITVRIVFINYLNSFSNMSISFESRNNYSVIGNADFNVGETGILNSFDNFSAPFTFTINNNTPPNTNIFFKLNFNSGNYTDFQLLNVTVNPTYSTQSSSNGVALTITSKGNLAFNDYPSNLEGKGFRYLNGNNLLFEGAFMMATSPTKISDAARVNDFQNSDFNIVQPFILKIPGARADQEGINIFNDDAAGTNKIGITSTLRSYTFDNAPDNNYIILSYSLKNNTESAITGLYAGLFLDWDLIDGSGQDDYTAFDQTGNLGYVHNVNNIPDTWVGAALISTDNYGYWGINNGGGDGGFGIYDGFSDAEKWQALSSGVGKANAGPSDISFVISGGPYNINPGDSVIAAFMIAAGLNLDDLKNAAANARNKFINVTDVDEFQENIPLIFSLEQNYPNPFNPNTSITWQSPIAGWQTIKIYDLLGREIATLVNEYRQAGKYEITFNAGGLSSGMYFYKLQAGSFSETKKMMLIK